jgi:chemotaxis protein methyltransferase CheR
MSHEILKFFSQFIERETGIVYQESNLYQLQSRLEQIVKLEKLEGLNDLHRIFVGTVNPFLRQKLLDISTNNETLFFRDPSFFAAISDFIIKDVLHTAPSEIKIWSAASSTGQEAISIAITLDELAKKRALPPFSILGTDISEKALAKAKSGFYTEFEVQRGLSDERKNQYFSKSELGWQLKPQIQSKISFRYNNLTRSTVKGPFHIILCRNVLIYQKVECKKGVVQNLLSQLDMHGGLMLGVGESLLGILDDASPQIMGNVPFYKIKSNKVSKIA